MLVSSESSSEKELEICISKFIIMWEEEFVLPLGVFPLSHGHVHISDTFPRTPVCARD